VAFINVTGTGVPYGDGLYNNPTVGSPYIAVPLNQFIAQLWGAGDTLWTTSGLGAGTDARTNIIWWIHKQRNQTTNGAKGTTVPNTPNGRANMAFADGHVEIVRSDEVADFVNKKSKFRVLWSPKDHTLQPN
jgi:prepilin-type processing-associated H-X9-DG protein